MDDQFLCIITSSGAASEAAEDGGPPAALPGAEPLAKPGASNHGSRHRGAHSTDFNRAMAQSRCKHPAPRRNAPARTSSQRRASDSPEVVSALEAALPQALTSARHRPAGIDRHGQISPSGWQGPALHGTSGAGREREGKHYSAIS